MAALPPVSITLAVFVLFAPGVSSAQPATQASTPPPMPSFKSLLTDIPADIRGLPTRTNGLWLGGSGALALAVRSEDREITDEAMNSLGLETALDSGAHLGNGLVQGGAALGTFIVGRMTHRPGVAVLGADLVRAQIINTGLTQALKVAVDRPRPDGARYSFPSGHSSSTFATATVLARHFGWKVGVPAYAMATYVASSRLTENQHFLSDVIFGAGLGIVSGRAVTVGHGKERFALGPMVVPGGAGVTFMKLRAQ
jgi:hypothetical protein